jgi:FkbM family methyltransferase
MKIDKKSFPLLTRAAFWWAAHGIRGRGAVPRAIGRWQNSNRPLLIKTRSGAALSVDYNNLDVYAHIFSAGGTWDANIMLVCERVLRPGDVFFDIGSNAGVFALDFAKLIPSLTVFAFEPQPSLAKHIRRSIEANCFAQIKLLEMMLGSQNGEGTLFLTSHSIHASTVPRESRYRELRVPLRTLDDLIAKGELVPPDVIKIDVEGSEFSVFQGAEAMLQAHQPSIIFETDENLNRLGRTIDDLFSLLSKAAPYDFYSIDNGGVLMTAQRPYPLGNFLALSPRHVGRI